MNTKIFIGLIIAFFTASICFSQVGAKKSSDRRVKILLDEADLKYEVDGDGDYKLANKLKDGRTHLIWILSQTSQLGTLEIRQIWSIGYRSKFPLSETLSNRLLKENAQVKIGAWQVRKMGDYHVAIFCGQIAADTDKISLLSAMQAVTMTADELEKDLTDKDDF